MKSLTLFPSSNYDHLVQPEEFNDLHPDSFAMHFLSDFRQHKPHMINSHLKASEALHILIAEDVTMKMVVDAKKEFIGVLDREHLSAENMLLKQISLGINYNELLVSDLMYPRSNILAVDFDQIVQAKLNDLVTALKNAHQEYLLVIDKDAHHIRGIISSREISRRLHQPVTIEKERTFVDIFTAVHVS